MAARKLSDGKEGETSVLCLHAISPDTREGQAGQTASLPEGRAAFEALERSLRHSHSPLGREERPVIWAVRDRRQSAQGRGSR
uniref:Uncharacterized protein n=1 Tax=Knipowitschia caucasica TaxID=637954 RepID=A0AAV2LKP6_KNICA